MSLFTHAAPLRVVIHPCSPTPLRVAIHPCSSRRRAERAACRRYAIMVTPTQSVPEVLAVWGSDYKKATVCRRYTIMVAQSPPQIPHITNLYHTPTPPPPTTHKKNEQQAQRLNCSFPLSTAVRTRLELATPCVTGMYSNQLNYRTSCRVCITAFFRFACAKLLLFPHSRKFFSKKFAFYPIFL